MSDQRDELGVLKSLNTDMNENLRGCSDRTRKGKMDRAYKSLSEVDQIESREEKQIHNSSAAPYML